MKIVWTCQDNVYIHNKTYHNHQNDPNIAFTLFYLSIVSFPYNLVIILCSIHSFIEPELCLDGKCHYPSRIINKKENTPARAVCKSSTDIFEPFSLP